MTDLLTVPLGAIVYEALPEGLSDHTPRGGLVLRYPVPIGDEGEIGVEVLRNRTHPPPRSIPRRVSVWTETIPLLGLNGELVVEPPMRGKQMSAVKAIFTHLSYLNSFGPAEMRLVLIALALLEGS